MFLIARGDGFKMHGTFCAFPCLRVKKHVDAFVCEGEAGECLSMCANTSCPYTCEIGMMSVVTSQKVRVCASL